MPRAKTFGWAGLAIALVIACAIILPQVALANSVEVAPDQTMTLYKGDREIIMHLQAGDQATVAYTFNVTQGGPVDLLLMDEAGFERYRLGYNDSFFLQGSVLNASQGQGTIDGLVPGEEYYLALDNSASPLEGANPVGPVEVEYGLEGQDVTEIAEQPWTYLLVLASIALVFGVVVVLLVRLRPAGKEPGANIVGLGRKYCPKCGEIVGTKVHKCPKCGNEW